MEQLSSSLLNSTFLQCCLHHFSDQPVLCSWLIDPCGASKPHSFSYIHNKIYAISSTSLEFLHGHKIVINKAIFIADRSPQNDQWRSLKALHWWGTASPVPTMVIEAFRESIDAHMTFDGNYGKLTMKMKAFLPTWYFISWFR